MTNCPPEIIEEFRFGLNYFFYEKNPLFGEVLAKNWENDVLVYKSTNNRGYVFYHKMLRATLDVPLVFVCNRRYRNIDIKIQHDRDRKAFDDEVLSKCIRLACRSVNTNGIETVVNLLEPWWEKGHKVLSALADSVHRNFQMKFPEQYYAKHSPKMEEYNPGTLSELGQTLSEFRSKGWKECPQYMAEFGMKTAISVIKERQKRSKEKHLNELSRKPTVQEHKALAVLSQAISFIDANLARRFSDAAYAIGNSDEIVGELRKGETYGKKAVYLSKSFFLQKFSMSVAILLHEWGHIYGYDGSRGFTDILTEFVGKIIDERDAVSKYEKEWTEISVEIRALQHQTNTEDMDATVDQMTSNEKSDLIKEIPKDMLFGLLHKRGYV